MAGRFDRVPDWVRDEMSVELTDDGWDFITLTGNKAQQMKTLNIRLMDWVGRTIIVDTQETNKLMMEEVGAINPNLVFAEEMPKYMRGTVKHRFKGDQLPSVDYKGFGLVTYGHHVKFVILDSL